MVLYNGNAEVVGNFRALNFYKASDINIKEDIRLLVEGLFMNNCLHTELFLLTFLTDQDPRDVILKIDGVEYKFKDNVKHSTNKRFVGYIAQQIESVVPSAVQLIDGILHVDYESLIPYLSESIKQNYRDIQSIKSDMSNLEKLLDKLYDQFTQPLNNKSTKPVPQRHQNQSKLTKYLNALRYKLPWMWILIISLVGVSIAFSIALYKRDKTDPDLHTIPPWTPPDYTGDSNAREALKIFYETMGGNYWTIQTNWMTSRSVCEWYGITCLPPYEEEQVVAINLPNNNITGGLNGQQFLYKLVTLREVDLSQNRIGFGISKLNPLITRLNLAENYIVDNINKLNQLENIRYLNIGYTYFYGEFQFTLRQLGRLKEFNASYSSMMSISSVDSAYEFESCDLSGVVVSCPVPEWAKMCGAVCI